MASFCIDKGKNVKLQHEIKHLEKNLGGKRHLLLHMEEADRVIIFWKMECEKMNAAFGNQLKVLRSGHPNCGTVR